MAKIRPYVFAFSALLLTFSLDPGSGKAAQPAQARVTWSQPSLELTAFPGTSQSLALTLKANSDISDARLEVVPALAELLRLKPTGLGTLHALEEQTAWVVLEVPLTTPLGEYEGTVHIRSGKRTIPNTLKVVLHVVPAISSMPTLIKTVKVTPAGNLVRGAFSRVSFVPGRERMIVVFGASLDHPEGGCARDGYAYREYTTDMSATGNNGVINCDGGHMDTGGLFVGNDFYFAGMAPNPANNGKEGWLLIKYNSVTWAELTRTYLELVSGMDPGDDGKEDPGDPMLAHVNGQIDVSSGFRPAGQPWGPSASGSTHHHFFTPDLQFIEKRLLSGTPHINLNSMLQTGDVINFVTGTSLLGDLVLMRYYTNWNLLDWKLLKPKSATSEGMAFDGKRFYVSYLDVPCEQLDGCLMNVRLASFDSDWNLIADIAVTNFTPPDLKLPSRPSLTLHDGRIYVCYDQCEDVTACGDPATAPIQVYVKVYDVSGQ